MNLPKTNFTMGWTQTFDPHGEHHVSHVGLEKHQITSVDPMNVYPTWLEASIGRIYFRVIVNIGAMELNWYKLLFFTLMCFGLASSQNITSGMIYKKLY